MIKLIYSVFVGVLLALFVGLGIATFYAQPSSPKWPTDLNYIKDTLTDDQRQIEKIYNEQQADWENKMKPYNRNVSLITLAAAIILVALSIFLTEHKYNFFADGTMFGGVFTLFYSLGRGFASQDSKYSFLLVTAGLVVVFILGYKRFHPLETNSTKKK